MFAFALAVFLLIITPGPGVLSTAGVGAAYGWRQGLFYVAGLCAGTNLVSLAVISGLAAVILAQPLVRTILLFASAGYLGYLALRNCACRSKNCLHSDLGAGFHGWSHVAVYQSQSLCGEYNFVYQLCFLSGQFCCGNRVEAFDYEYDLAAFASALAVCWGKAECAKPACPYTKDN